MPGVRDIIGRRGETITTNLLTRRHERSLSYFNPVFFGDKQDSIDFYVEFLNNNGGLTPYFLVQVKTTGKRYYKNGKLKASVPKRSMDALRRYPAPTYVIGVEERDEAGFVWAVVDGGLSHLSSFPTTYSLSDERTLEMLYSEVTEYWARVGRVFTESRFSK